MKTILICLLLVKCILIEAQTTPFITEGVIEYEKSVNMYAFMQRLITKDNELTMKQLVENYRKTNPQFKTVKSNLSFSGTKTLFEPVAESSISTTSIRTDDAKVAQYSIIYTDIPAKTSISQKTVYEQTFLIKDVARPIKWKFTEETREIAGYTCRRANGLMLDSIYVVAFYTEDIPVSGGPESFNGLPGMILGVSLPDEHVTWFATKIALKSINNLKAPSKGKAVNNKELREALESALKNTGKDFKDLLKAFLL